MAGGPSTEPTLRNAPSDLPSRDEPIAAPTASGLVVERLLPSVDAGPSSVVETLSPPVVPELTERILGSPEVAAAIRTLKEMRVELIPETLRHLIQYRDNLAQMENLLATTPAERAGVYRDERLQTTEEAFDCLVCCRSFLKGVSEELRYAIRAGECVTLDGAKVIEGVPLVNRLLGMGPDDIDAAVTPLTRGVFHSKPFPSAEETLAHIAKYGSLPDVVTSLAHEEVHLKQITSLRQILNWAVSAATLSSVGAGGWLALAADGKGALAAGVALVLGVPTLLSKLASFLQVERCALEEVHAGVAKSSLFSVRDPEGAFTMEKSRLRDAETGAPEATIKRAAEVIRQLILLGEEEGTIRGVVASADYDSASGSYPRLEECLQNRRNTLGLYSEDVFEEVVRALEAQDTIERVVTQREAQAIALAYFEASASQLKEPLSVSR